MAQEKNVADFEVQRHSLEHVMVLAIRRLFGENIKLGVGPVIENGFYQDLETKLIPEDFARIEAEMANIIAENLPIEKDVVDIDAAIAYFAERNQPYKVELLEDIKAKGSSKVDSSAEAAATAELTEQGLVTFYTIGMHRDLCRGPHVASTSELAGVAYKMDRIAGAYWRGDEKNPMLTRIYAVAFPTQAELDAYYATQEEAKKRDHRLLGKQLGLFFISDLVGGGLNLWTPKGTVIRDELDKFVWALRKEKNYSKVAVPHITKRDLYDKSGHWEKFADELFKITTREGHEFALKPMNCPHHSQIFAFEPRSYRDMPQRYCETTMVYRDEQSGELSGLTRVRAITQDDSHVFCRHSQVAEEFNAIWDIVEKFYGAFGLKLKMRLSFHDPADFSKYLGTSEIWNKAESQLEEMAKARGADYFIAKGEAAMYGPKSDFMAIDSLGREHQVATVQLDMNLPERFDLYCTNEEGAQERIVMIHCAIMGSIERFSAVMIEHLAGNFPAWLAPVQLKLLPISGEQFEYAEKVKADLLAAGVAANLDLRIEVDLRAETLQAKIRDAAEQKLPYSAIIGKREAAANSIALRVRGKGDIGAVTVDDFAQKFIAEILERKLESSF